MIVTLVVLASALATVVSVGQVAGPKISFDVKIDPAMLERAAGLNVYKLGAPTITENLLPAIQRGLFGDGSVKPVRTGEFLALSDAQRPSYFLMLNPRTGYLSFDRGLADQIDEKAGTFPDDAGAQRLAQDFFAKLDLLPAVRDEIVFDHTSHIFSASFDPQTGRQGKALPQVLVVYFARQLDGVRVIGPGSKLIARFGDGGEIVGGSVRWRPATRMNSAKALGLRNVDQVRRDITAFLAREQNEASSIVVQKIGLSYFDQDGAYIQPVVGYEALIQRGRNMSERYLGQTPVLLKPVENVVPTAVTPAMLDAVKRSSQATTAPPNKQGSD